MRRNVILSTVAATVMTGVLMMTGCTSNGSSSSIADITDTDKNGATLKGEISITSPDGTYTGTLTGNNGATNLGTATASDITMKDLRDLCTVAKPCIVQVNRDCYKETTGMNELTGYDNKCVRDSAFAEVNRAFEEGALAAAGISIPAGKVVRFSGALEISEENGRIDRCGSLKIEFKAPPCATDSDGTWHYVNNQAQNGGVVDTATLLVLVTPLANECGVSADPFWLEVPITDPKSFDLRKAVVDLVGGVALPARLFVYAVQNAETTGTTGSTTGAD